MSQMMSSIVIDFKVKLFKCVKKNITTYERIQFFKQCLIDGIVPNFLVMDGIFQEPKHFGNIIRAFQRRSIKKLISINYKQLKEQKLEINNCKMVIKKNDGQFFKNIIMELKLYKQFLKGKLKQKYANKVKHLCRKNGGRMVLSMENSPGSENIGKVYNNTDLKLSIEQMNVLSKGVKYIPSCNKINKLEILTDLECGISKMKNNNQLDDNELNNTVNILKGRFNNTFNDFNKYQYNKNLNYVEKNEIKILQELKELSGRYLFTKPDKSKEIVILYKEEYIRKMEEHLGNTNIFKLCGNINLDVISRKIGKEIDALIKEGNLDKEFNDLVITKYPVMPVPYGMPKVNKDGWPLRIIIPATGSITYNLSKFLYGYLINDIPYKYNRLKNSLQVKEEIVQYLNKFKKITKFDVVALFDNIPLEETIDVILENHRNNKKSKDIKISEDQLKTLLNYIKNNNFCRFNDRNYLQIDGTPMGSPISTILSETFMVYLENKYINEKLYGGFRWYRYVDDVIILHNMTNRQIDNFHNYLNQLHNKIKFTKEEIVGNNISFMDLEINFRYNGVQTGVHHKKENQLYINWQSGHSRVSKIGLINTLLSRADRLCSDTEMLNKEINIITDNLVKNGYPYKIVNDTVVKYFTHRNLNSSNQENKRIIEENNIYLPFDYYDKYTENLLRPIKNTMKYTLSNYKKIKFAYKPKKCIGKILKYDDNKKVADKDIHGCVYEYECRVCKDTYIGETRCKLKERIQNHRNKGLDSKIYEHFAKTGHNIITEDFKVIEVERNNERRKVKESYYIKKLMPKMNGDKKKNLYIV